MEVETAMCKESSELPGQQLPLATTHFTGSVQAPRETLLSKINIAYQPGYGGLESACVGPKELLHQRSILSYCACQDTTCTPEQDRPAVSGYRRKVSYGAQSYVLETSWGICIFQTRASDGISCVGPTYCCSSQVASYRIHLERT